MRFDKFTTSCNKPCPMPRVWQWVATNQFIEPQHLLLSMLNDADSGAGSLLAVQEAMSMRSKPL